MVRPSALAVLRLITSSIFGRRLHWQVGGLLAFEDAIDVAGRATVLFDVIRPVGDQATSGGEDTIEVDCGQFVPGRQRDDQIAMKLRQRARRHDQAAIRSAREGRDGALDLARVAHVDRSYLHPERRRHGLDYAKLANSGGCGGIPKNRHSRHARRDLLEQLQPFPADAVFEIHEPGGVAARPRQAVDEAGADRIDDDREHDRHGAGRLQQRPHGRGGRGQDDVRRERGQFRRVPANLGGIGRGPAGVDAHVAADGPAQLLPALAGTPRRGPDIPHRPRLRAGVCRRAA